MAWPGHSEGRRARLAQPREPRAIQALDRRPHPLGRGVQAHLTHRNARSVGQIEPLMPRQLAGSITRASHEASVDLP